MDLFSVAKKISFWRAEMPKPQTSCIRWIYTNTMPRDLLEDCIGFDWDEANPGKNWDLHQVTTAEAEDVFFHEPLVVRSDLRHSGKEKRYYALGQTSTGRTLFLAFTIRKKLIRVISVRNMNRREREAYERHEENYS
jgi:uncharacterized DUF497 family protein